MAYSTPPNFTTGAIVTETQLDTLSDDIAFLANPPKCRVYNSANISVPHNTPTALAFNSERFDSDTMHSTAVNTSRITFTTAGTYLVGGGVTWAGNTAGIRDITLRLGGATNLATISDDVPSGFAYSWSQSVATLYTFSAGQYVELIANQDSGGALNSLNVGNCSPEFWAILQAVA